MENILKMIVEEIIIFLVYKKHINFYNNFKQKIKKIIRFFLHEK